MDVPNRKIQHGSTSDPLPLRSPTPEAIARHVGRTWVTDSPEEQEEALAGAPSRSYPINQRQEPGHERVTKKDLERIYSIIRENEIKASSRKPNCTITSSQYKESPHNPTHRRNPSPNTPERRTIKPPQKKKPHILTEERCLNHMSSEK